MEETMKDKTDEGDVVEVDEPDDNELPTYNGPQDEVDQ
jgi:hypothetical protein